MIDALASSPLVQAIGATLVAFLWQGSAIGVAAFIVLSTLKRATAHARYVAACVALTTMAATVLVTFVREADRFHADVAAAASSPIAPVAPAGPEVDGTLTAVNVSAVVGRADAALPFVVIGWSAGVTLLTLHVLFGWLQIGRLRRRARAIDDDAWLSRLSRMAARLSVGRRVLLLESALVDVPAVIGWLRPAILVPASAFSGLAPWQLDAILAHELAHIRRADFVVNLAQRAIEIALFYHPAVWWVSSEIRREREHCCDDIAATCCDSRRDYAAALGALAALHARTPALAMGARNGDLIGRIRRLVDARSAASRSWSGGHIMVIVPAAMFLLASVSASATQSVAPDLPAVAAPAISPALSLRLPDPVEPPVVQPSPARVAVQATGRLSGDVRDDDGGVIPGVTVSVHAPGQFDRSVVTNTRGQFSFDNLALGTYSVRAGSLPGFQSVSVDVSVGAGETTVPFQLPLGMLTEHVRVAGARGNAATVTLGVAPAQSCDTWSDCFTAAGTAYGRGDFGATDALLNQAISLLRTERPGLFQLSVPRSSSFPPSSAGGTPIRVGGSITPPRKIVNVTPIYPPDALAAGVAGTVTMQAVIGKDGSVLSARILSGHPELNVSALDAVRLWKFTPTLLNGVPAVVNATVTVDFEIR